MDTSVHPPKVVTLSCSFKGWLGDDLLETFPCFLVTDQLKNHLHTGELSGCDYDRLAAIKSREFEELYPGRLLPNFHWLKVFGIAGKDDFGVMQDGRLVVSDRALGYLKHYSLEHCEIEEFNNSKI